MAAFFSSEKWVFLNLKELYIKIRTIRMRKGILLSAMSLTLMAACTKDNLTESHDSLVVTINGNFMSGFAGKNSRASTTSYIPENASILFYSTGGVKAEGDILNYENGQWTGLKDNKWYVDEGEAHITAYYPVINNSDELYYENGELKDVVCCKMTASQGEDIKLTFSHIFSKLAVSIESELNSTVKSLKINIPKKINRIELPSGAYSFDENGNSNVELDKNEEGKYEVFIPVCDDMDISLDLVCDDKTSSAPIANKKYQAGFEYSCNIQKGKGIYTEKDFIAFTHLINGEQEYNGKTLEDYQTIKGGRKVYNLYNNLSFTDEESALIRRIGDYNKTFNDIFDGNNHTIDNLTLSSNNKSPNMGLFDKTTDSTMIRNLTLSNCKFVKEEYYKTAALLVGMNKGIIENCHVLNGTMPDCKPEDKLSAIFSGFVTQNIGTSSFIVNCSVSGIKLNKGQGYHGILTWYNEGQIINCRIKGNLNKASNGSSSSIITTRNKSGRIFNVFVEDYKEGFYGVCHTNEDNGQYYNCMIPSDYSNKVIKKGENNPEGVKLYSDTQEEYEAMAKALNGWIDGVGKSMYPDFTFRKWKTDPTEKLIFE